jgi:hypothetical protein
MKYGKMSMMPENVESTIMLMLIRGKNANFYTVSIYLRMGTT